MPHRTLSGETETFAKAIVERHGGSIGVESTPGAGTRFEFSLPMVGESSAQAVPGLPGFETVHGPIAACGPYSVSPSQSGAQAAQRSKV